MEIRIGLALAFLICTPAFASDLDDWSDCLKLKGDAGIAACTRFIDKDNPVPADKADAYNQRGYLWMQEGQYANAIADSSAAIAINNAKAAYYDNRSDAESLTGKFDNGFADAELALRLDPNDLPGLYDRGLAHFGRREYDLAVADLTAYLERKSNNDVLRLRGLAEASSNKLDAAIDDLSKVIAADNADSNALAVRGAAYIAKDELDRAIADYSAALKINPKFSAVYNDRGLAYVRESKLDLAVADFDQAIQLSPQFFRLYCNRGYAYGRQQKFEEASSDFDEAIKLHPGDALCLFDRSQVYSYQNKHELSIADVTEAIRLSPKNYAYFLHRASEYILIGNVDLSIADSDTAVGLEPDLPYAYNNRCWARGLKGTDLTNALADCNMALKLQPTQPASAMDSLAFVYFRMGRYADAISEYDKTLAIAPKLAPSYFGRGLAKLRTGDQTGGKADIAQAQQIDPHVGDVFAKYGITP